MAVTPKTITVDVRLIPTVREALAEAWDQAAIRLANRTLDEDEWPLEGWLSENPYRNEPGGK